MKVHVERMAAYMVPICFEVILELCFDLFVFLPRAAAILLIYWPQAKSAAYYASDNSCTILLHQGDRGAAFTLLLPIASHLVKLIQYVSENYLSVHVLRHCNNCSPIELRPEFPVERQCNGGFPHTTKSIR